MKVFGEGDYSHGVRGHSSKKREGFMDLKRRKIIKRVDCSFNPPDIVKVLGKYFVRKNHYLLTMETQDLN